MRHAAPPVATTGTITVNPFTVFSGNLNRFATDPDNDPLTIRLVNAPTYGQIVINADGTFTYQGSLLNPGTDSFTFVVGDGQYFSAPETITINLTQRSGYGYYIRDFWGLAAPGDGDAVADRLRVTATRAQPEPTLITPQRTDGASGVDGVHLVRRHFLTIRMPVEATEAITVTVASVHSAGTDAFVATDQVSVRLTAGRLELTFDPTLPPGAYDLVIRITLADGSIVELPLTVFISAAE